MFIRVIATFLVVMGAAGFFMPFWVGFFVSDLNEFEFPVSDFSDVAVSDDDELYFALTFSGTIQKYSSDGQYVQGYNVDSGGGSFCFTLTNDELFVHAPRRDSVFVYDLSRGSVRQDRPINESSYRAVCDWHDRIVSVDSTISQVMVQLSERKEPIIIHRKLWHYLALHPITSWLMFVIGLFLIPEWRRPVLSAFVPDKSQSKQVKPEGIFLKSVDFVLNVFFTLYGLVFTSIGFLLIVVSLQTAEGATFNVFAAILGVIFVLFSLYWIYRLWTSYGSTIRLAPGISFEVNAAGAVAWKAFALVLMAVFIASIFYFGAKLDKSEDALNPLPYEEAVKKSLP